MEEPREQQPVAPASIPPQPHSPPSNPYPSAPQAMYQPPQPMQSEHEAIPQAQPSTIEIIGRVIRLLLARMIWAGDQLWRLIAPRFGWVVLTSFLVGVIGLLSLLLIIPRIVAVTSSPSGDTRVAMIPPAASVVDFLRGQQTYDADLMWESFSPELRQNLEEREITRDTLAEQIESERQAGQRYRGFEYIGGIELGNSQSMYFYAVDIQSPSSQGMVSFVFTVDRDGKIVSVE